MKELTPVEKTILAAGNKKIDVGFFVAAQGSWMKQQASKPVVVSSKAGRG